jgi:hypothetical protein
MERPRFDSGKVWQLAIRRAKCASFALSIIRQLNGCEKGMNDRGPIPARNISFSVPFRRVRSQSDPISEKTSTYYRPVHWRAVPMLITHVLAEQNGGSCSAKRCTQTLSWWGLFFEMSDGFHGTTRVNVISNTPIREVRPSPRRTSPESKMFVSIMYRPHVPNFIQIGQKMCKVRVEIHLVPYVKCGVALDRFSRNLEMLISIMCRLHVLNFIQIGQKMCKVRVEIHLVPYVKCGAALDRFSRNLEMLISIMCRPHVLNFTQIGH